MRKLLFLFITIVSVTAHCQTYDFSGTKRFQGPVAIGTTTPGASAVLDITSTTKGVLFPRLTTTQMNAISAPVAGLLIYNTTTNDFYRYNGSAWVASMGSTGATGPTGSNGSAGATGPTGPTGSNGSAGATGATGPTGSNGSVGATGATGPTGSNGSAGATGATGPTGGVTGITVSSTTIASGTSGRIGFNGSGVYSEDDGLTYSSANKRLTLGGSAATIPLIARNSTWSTNFHVTQNNSRSSGAIGFFNDAGSAAMRMSVLYRTEFSIQDDNSGSLAIYGTTNEIRHGFNTSIKTGASPTAVLTIGAGDGTISPLRLTSATFNSTKAAGQVNYDGIFGLDANSGLRFTLGGALTEFFTDVSNTSTTETDLYSYTLPANSITTTGEKIVFNYTVNTLDPSSSGSTKTIKIYFAGTTISTISTTAIRNYIITGYCLRTGSSTARCSCSTIGSQGSPTIDVSDLTGITWSNSNIVKITGQSSFGSTEVTARLGRIEYLPIGK